MDEDDDDADVMPLTNSKEEEGGEEDMISMALRMAEEMSGPIADLESAVEAVPINTGWFYVCVRACFVASAASVNQALLRQKECDIPLICWVRSLLNLDWLLLLYSPTTGYFYDRVQTMLC